MSAAIIMLTAVACTAIAAFIHLESERMKARIGNKEHSNELLLLVALVAIFFAGVVGAVAAKNPPAEQPAPVAKQVRT